MRDVSMRLKPDVVNDASTVLSVVLTVVYLYGGWSKMQCPRHLRGTLISLGIPRRLATVGSRAMPVVEVVSAVVIFATSGAVQDVALGILALVLVAGLGATLPSRGKSIPCACFGPTDLTELGHATWVRNGSLLAVSVMVVALSAPSALDVALSSATGLTVVLVAACTTATLLHLGVKSARHEALLKELPLAINSLQQLPIQNVLGGERLPRPVANLRVQDRDGVVTDLRTLTSRATQVLVLTTPDCGACQALLPQLPHMQTIIGDLAEVRVLSLVPLCKHPAPDDEAHSTLFAVDPTSAQLWATSVLAPGTPVAAVVRDGLIMTHDALSDTHDPDAFLEELRQT